MSMTLAAKEGDRIRWERQRQNGDRRAPPWTTQEPAPDDEPEVSPSPAENVSHIQTSWISSQVLSSPAALVQSKWSR